VTDGDRCLYSNQRWVELTGLTSADCAHDAWLAAVHAEDRTWLEAKWRAFLGSESRELRVRTRLQGSTGTERVVHICGSVLEDGVGYLITLEEAGTGAEGPLAADDLVHARKMEAVGRLASGLAHDFANLLTLISGYSEIILSRLGARDSLRGEVEEVRKAASRGSALTRQLLAFSRRQTVEPQVIDLNTLVNDMQKMLRRMIGEHIDLTTSLSPNLYRVKVDPGQMEQVVMNLAVNARDAMPRGGKISICTANVELTESEEPVKKGLTPGPYVMLQFSDNGHGMNAETLQHLFEPFFTTKEKGKGTGLGLATIHAVVKEGHGDVWAQSQVGRGTTFTIYLPRVEGTIEQQLQEGVSREEGSGTETILLVEDEDGVRRLLKHVLVRRGYNVLEAATGAEALSILQRERGPIHLLLTDIVMPRMSGRELADKVVRLRPDLKVIFMSGYTDEVLIGAGGTHPGAVFLQKPLRPEMVVARVREVLDGTGEDATASYARSRG
jgi:signal transduction histidine kinase/ActR/RegA family two-component response regulator